MSGLSTLPDKLQHILKVAKETQQLKKWEMKQQGQGEVVLQLVFDETEKKSNPGEVSKSTVVADCCGISKDGKAAGKLKCVADYEDYCRLYMEKAAWIYFSRGSMGMQTVNRNVDAFRNILIWPKHLVDVSCPMLERTIQTTGETVSLPIGISPTAFQAWATPAGERATVRAAKNAGIVYISSLYSNIPLEDIAKTEPDALMWQHMQIFRDQSFNEDMLHRAEKAKVSAIVLTIDRPEPPITWHEDFEYWDSLHSNNFGSEEMANASTKCHDATWEDVAWFCQQTSLPVILKGVLTQEDVRMAIQVGAKGVIVSNHGGRVVDSLPATIEVLRSVVVAAEGKLEVFFDGGIRTGMDVFKALAYGARMVFIGRPAIWGLGHSGQAGLSHVIEILKEELLNIMRMAGTPTLSDITLDRIYSG